MSPHRLPRGRQRREWRTAVCEAVRERIQGFLKANVEVIYDKSSLVPVFDPKRLTDSDLSDLVGYLGTLRGYDVAVR